MFINFVLSIGQGTTQNSHHASTQVNHAKTYHKKRLDNMDTTIYQILDRILK